MANKKNAETKKSETKKCPMCAETIDIGDAVCRYCGTKFILSKQGYCQTCHRHVAVDTAEKCQTCGNPVIDLRETSITKEPEMPRLAVPGSIPVIPQAAEDRPQNPGPILPYAIGALHFALAMHFISFIPNMLHNYSELITHGMRFNYTQIIGIIAVIGGVLLLIASAVFLFLRRKAGYYLSVVYAVIAIAFLAIWIKEIWNPVLPLRILVVNCIYYAYPFFATLCLSGRLKKDFR